MLEGCSDRHAFFEGLVGSLLQTKQQSSISLVQPTMNGKYKDKIVTISLLRLVG